MDKKKARGQLGFEPDESIVLYVGRFDPVKGIDRLFAAISHLGRRQRLRLVVIGGDGRRASTYRELENLSRKLGIQDLVLFAGRIDHENLPPYYSASDVLVVPSYYESFGLVGLESLACGTPVVTTRVGVLEHILRQGRSGQVVENGCPRSLAEGIEKFISNSTPETFCAEKIRASVLQYSWTQVARAIVNEYANIFWH